jgi:hypothetical protein
LYGLPPRLHQRQDRGLDVARQGRPRRAEPRQVGVGRLLRKRSGKRLCDASLDDLPHLASVEGDLKGWPERVVVHLRDWHLVPRDAFDKDVKAAAGRDLSKDELDRLYAEHLDAVESVQKQLDAILRRLAASHRGLPVYVEGLTDDGVNVFKLKATALSDVGAEQIPEARRSLAEARKLKGQVAAELAKRCESLIARHRSESLELGAVLGPCAEGLVEVRALDDAEALKAAEPRWLGGELFDPAAVRAREDAMARRLADAKEPLVVALLGGGHDLGAPLSLHAPKVRYVRLTVDAYREASGER